MRVSIHFQGRVQGVGFRATTRDIVQRRPLSTPPLTGWVRNQPDGSVLMELQGPPAAVEAALIEIQTVMSRYIRASYRSETTDITGEHSFRITH